MRAELKGLDSPDLPEDRKERGSLIGLEDYQPPNLRSFRLAITAEIGPNEAEAADLFDFVLYTPDEVPGLRLPAAHLPPAPPRAKNYSWGEGVLVMREWSYEDLVTAVHEIVSAATGEDWNAVVSQLRGYMNWEFADYRA